METPNPIVHARGALELHLGPHQGLRAAYGITLGLVCGHVFPCGYQNGKVIQVDLFHLFFVDLCHQNGSNMQQTLCLCVCCNLINLVYQKGNAIQVDLIHLVFVDLLPPKRVQNATKIFEMIPKASKMWATVCQNEAMGQLCRCSFVWGADGDP